jgi:hypothetical protein
LRQGWGLIGGVVKKASFSMVERGLVKKVSFSILEMSVVKKTFNMAGLGKKKYLSPNSCQKVVKKLSKSCHTFRKTYNFFLKKRIFFSRKLIMILENWV